MTEMQARGIANAILASAAVAVAVVVIRTPRLRQLVVNTTRAWLGGQNVPAYLAAEAGRAWTESGRAIMSR